MSVWPKNCYGARESIREAHLKCAEKAILADTFFADAGFKWIQQDYEGALLEVINGCHILVNACQFIANVGTPWANGDVIPWYVRNCAGGAGLDMSELIGVMLLANPSEIEYFVGLSDAYRQSIWNRPFNQEMFAALARGFEEWG